MIHEIKLHGKANEKLDYFATIMGSDLSSRYFYESLPEGDRFFSGSNEFIITPTGISYAGTGGSLCEYMFGVDLPLKDLLRKGVPNRLIMNGAFIDTGKITFTNNTAGKESFDHVFMAGNAVSNYYFFIHTSKNSEIKDIQRDILKNIGKKLKRSPAVGAVDDTQLCKELFEALEDSEVLVFLFRLLNLHNHEYLNTVNKYYSEQKPLSDKAHKSLEALAKQYRIVPYQQERIKIDGMSKLPENKKIVDEYKDILISASEKGEVNPSQLAKLSRLRTLSLRINIPHNFFDTLDEHLLKDMEIVEVEEPGYLREIRAIFEGLFPQVDKLKGHISREDLIKLLMAKQKSTVVRDQAFEGLLLDMVRTCDEHARDTNDTSALEAMSRILTYFDRFDSTATMVNNLACMEDSTLSEDNIQTILGNKEVFDDIHPDLFRDLFIHMIGDDRYVTRYGRKKVDMLHLGLQQIKTYDITYRDLSASITKLNDVDKMYMAIHRYIKNRVKSIYAELNSKDDQEIFIQDLNHEIQSKGIVQSPVPHIVFEEIILDIRKEFFYLNNLLPHIIVSRDNQVRKDFLINSGLDRFYVEELEKNYFDMNKIEQNILEEIRK